jgi:hypothetical protein
MLANLFDELTSRGAIAVMGMFLGGVITWLLARWKRFQEHRSILRGDARDTVAIHVHLVDSKETPKPEGGTHRVPQSLRIRSLGQAELNRVIPNGHLAAVLLHRAFRVTTLDTLISMHDAEGSYLLETLTNFVCDRVANAPFECQRAVKTSHRGEMKSSHFERRGIRCRFSSTLSWLTESGDGESAQDGANSGDSTVTGIAMVPAADCPRAGDRSGDGP